jgi:hypothetical protein
MKRQSGWRRSWRSTEPVAIHFSWMWRRREARIASVAGAEKPPAEVVGTGVPSGGAKAER